jgi:uncharacterized membrane protein
VHGAAIAGLMGALITKKAALKNKNVNPQRAVIIAAILTVLGFLMTFPPFFDLFAGG